MHWTPARTPQLNGAAERNIRTVKEYRCAVMHHAGAGSTLVWDPSTLVKVVGTGAVGASVQGTSVSLSSDGNTLAVGGYGDNSGIGATWIFARVGSTWSQQGSKLMGTGGGSRQGRSVSLSSDGNTLAAGEPAYMGATWIFSRNSNTWAAANF